MMIMFILSPNTVNKELCKELYTLVLPTEGKRRGLKKRTLEKRTL